MDRPKIRREWYRTNTQKADSVTIAFMTVPYSATLVGQRIRYYRLNLGLSQEKLAELSGCHPTYVGQLERGEKNATIESIERISSALSVSLSRLFEKIGNDQEEAQNIPRDCYEFLLTKTPVEQEQLYNILLEIDKYKTF
jgi:transcriptional regulator with XRE-family HTH domain